METCLPLYTKAKQYQNHTNQERMSSGLLLENSLFSFIWLFTFDCDKRNALSLISHTTVDYISNCSLPPCFHLLCLLLGCGSAKKVKVNLEPLVDVGVDGVVLVADLLWCQTLLSGLVLCSCAILICATYRQHVPASQTAIP